MIAGHMNSVTPSEVAASASCAIYVGRSAADVAGSERYGHSLSQQ